MVATVVDVGDVALPSDIGAALSDGLEVVASSPCQFAPQTAFGEVLDGKREAHVSRAP